MAKRKADGIEILVARQDPVSIQEITMLDWCAAFAMLGIKDDNPKDAARQAFEKAEAMLEERAQRIH
jgi:hypothetical protein